VRVFVAGASGALGARLVPMLLAAGHDVVGTTTTRAKFDRVAQAGAEPVMMDGLDERSVRDAVRQAQPDAVIHQLTALAHATNLKRFDDEFALTNQLRVTGTDNLLAAAREVGAKRFIAQSYTGWTNERGGDRVQDESAPLDSHPTVASRQTLAAIAHVERVVPAVEGMDGLVLRYGGFYGPGTSLGIGGELIKLVRRRRFPLVGSGAGVWSFVHIDDAARATLQALDHGLPGVYNIVDDEPAPVSEWLPYLAAAVGAKPPLRLPSWLARPVVGEHGLSMMTQIRGSSNAKAKRELEWRLAYPTWRDGFRNGLG
jgi:2-alkyl-3-oxoalkanoate reductase